MKYNTEKNKHILLPIETKDKLDQVILTKVKKRIENGDMRLRVSYNDCIKELLESYEM